MSTIQINKIRDSGLGWRPCTIDHNARHIHYDYSLKLIVPYDAADTRHDEQLPQSSFGMNSPRWYSKRAETAALRTRECFELVHNFAGRLNGNDVEKALDGQFCESSGNAVAFENVRKTSGDAEPVIDALPKCLT